MTEQQVAARSTLAPAAIRHAPRAWAKSAPCAAESDYAPSVTVSAANEQKAVLQTSALQIVFKLARHMGR